MDRVKQIQQKLESNPSAVLSRDEAFWCVLEILTLRQLERGYQEQLADYVHSVTSMRRDVRCLSTRD